MQKRLINYLLRIFKKTKKSLLFPMKYGIISGGKNKINNNIWILEKSI